MTDDPGKGTIFEGRGATGKAGGCLVLLLFLAVEIAAAFLVGGAVLDHTAGLGKAASGVLAFVAGALALWLVDRVAKRVTGISPARSLAETLPGFP